MPLSKGSGKKTIGKNIKELIHTYKEKGKIGNTTPKDMKHARKIASAIAYEKAGKKKSTQVEALEDFILSLADGKNNTLIENVIMEAFDVCFNSILIEDVTQVTTPTTTPSSTPSPTTAVLDTTNLSPDQIKMVAAQAQVVADKKAQETQEQQKLQALSTPPTTPTTPSNNNPQKIA